MSSSVWDTGSATWDTGSSVWDLVTDIRIGGVARETLGATPGELRVGGLVRETLNTGGLTTRVNVAGMAREALLRGVTAGAGPRQYAVTISVA